MTTTAPVEANITRAIPVTFAGPMSCPSSSHPDSAATAGDRLSSTENTAGAIRRRAARSRAYGNAEDSTATTAPNPAPTQTTATSYTMDQVAQHSTAESCWSVVNGKVYDLTDWVTQHPGGKDAITGMCGTDATAAFEGKHGGESDPATALDGYLLGALG